MIIEKLQKNIEKTIDTNIKMINNLSSVSKQLIIKSMTWK